MQLFTFSKSAGYTIGLQEVHVRKKFIIKKIWVARFKEATTILTKP
jgi:hypothetical protein